MNLDSVLERHAQVEEFRRKHRTGLVTLLFTDIVGSTKLKQNLGDQEGMMLIERHHTLVRELLKGIKDAQEIKTAGDSFFIVFATPSDAVRFCLLMQARLRSLAKETRLPVLDRAGIHVGEVFIEEEGGLGRSKDFFGIQVDTCARVMSLAKGDQILMTRFAFDNARQLLKGQAIAGVGPISWLNHGRYSLKGVEDPLEVCEVGEIGKAVLSPPPDSEKAHPVVSADSEPVLGWRPAAEQVVPNTQWVLEEKLGEGGFGEVWLGRHETLKKKRVFKFCFRADRVRSLKREVTLFRLLKERIGEHPNIVTVQDVFLNEPPFYLVMDYAEGKDLKSWAEAQGGLQKISLAIRLEMVAQVAEALQAAHDAGVIHRDLKPSNILIRQRPSAKVTECPTAQLTDFGIGQVVSAEVLSEITRLGFTETMVNPSSSSQSGTFIYMAPELIAGKPASPRSDIYSLGVVLFQVIVGDLARPVTPDWADDIPDPLLREDLKHCFARAVEGRFAKAGELAANLRSLEQRRSSLEKQKAVIATREKQLFWWSDWRLGSTGAALAVLLGLICLISPFDLGLTKLSYDFPFALHRKAVPGEAVIVYMDETSHQRLEQHPQGPWNRSLHVQLLNELTARGATAVVFDVLFDTPWLTDATVDRDLAAGIKAHGKVVLAAKLDLMGSENGPLVSRLIGPIEMLSTNAHVGAVELPKDTDGTVRRHHADVNYTGLAWKSAEVTGMTLRERTRKRWINYYGPKGAIPHVSYFQVLETNALRPDFFSNKVVFVGMAPIVTFQGRSGADEYGTPYTRWTGHMSPGVEVQATAFLNLVGRDWLEELSPLTELLLLIAVGGVFGYGLASTKPWIALRLGSAAFLLIGTGACLLLWTQHVWFPWLIVCAVQIPCALGWSVLANTRRLYRERELLQKAIAAPVPAPQSSTPAAQSESGPEKAPVAPASQTGTAIETSTLFDAPAQKAKTGAAPERTAANFVPPIPDHELIRNIGQGAYGQVWLAKDVIGTYHAVKIVFRKTFDNDGPFEREFRGIQKFTPISRSHPGFVNILHVGKNDAAGYFYYVMELADDEVAGQKIDPFTYSGKSLATELSKRGKLPVTECLKLSLNLTAALDYLHGQQLIHRDIKPSNIIFVHGAPKFADIGLVTELGRPDTDMSYVGTKGYIPPEGPGTAAADIYSLGKVLYEASMGRDRQRFPELPTTLAERPDQEDLLRLNEIILKACEADSDKRYKSAVEMHADLERLQANCVVS